MQIIFLQPPAPSGEACQTCEAPQDGSPGQAGMRKFFAKNAKDRSDLLFICQIIII